MDNLIFKNFTKTTEEEKKLIHEWRNSDRIRSKMTNQEIISYNCHLKWINNLENVKNSFYYLFYIGNVPIGVFDIIDIDFKKSCCEYGSYIGDKKYNGYGILLTYYGFKHIFEDLNIQKINITILKTNNRTYKMVKSVFEAKNSFQDKNNDFLYIDKTIWINKKLDINDYYKNYKNIIWI